MSSSIRWLHLSDFHFGKDPLGETHLSETILAMVKSKVAQGKMPDLIFITGDVAFSGLKTQYDLFVEKFYFPLLELLQSPGNDWPGKIFVIPGNHDFDVKQNTSFYAQDSISKMPRFLDPTAEGRDLRKILFPRYSGFLETGFLDVGGEWIESELGCFAEMFSMNGRQIGVLGLNTAWLSDWRIGEDADRFKLSPGKMIVDRGLKAISEADVKIVIGHHPIDWFVEDDDHAQAIRSMFADHRIIYLHGHLHQNESESRQVGHGQYLVIQAGAAFQARENSKWVNRFLWCELDFDAGEVLIEPFRWNNRFRRWVEDADAFHPDHKKINTPCWSFKLPTPDAAPTSLVAVETTDKELKPPEGWVWIDQDFLAQRLTSLTRQSALAYFDGLVLDWEHALAREDIPRRGYVRQILSKISLSLSAGERRVTLLIGASGEGKSTILRQVVCDLIDFGTECRVLWHHNVKSALPLEFLTQLSQMEGRWLLVSDDAHLIDEEVLEAVRLFQNSPRKNIQFLLTARGTDWSPDISTKLEKFAIFDPIEIRELTLDDAKRIVSHWEQYGHEGMGSLAGLDMEVAAERLVTFSKSEENAEEGAFLGAMLNTRLKDELKTHITRLLEGFEATKVPGGKTLLDAYAYLAAMHAKYGKGFPKLWQSVLEEAMGCRPRELKRQVIIPLWKEAFVVSRMRRQPENKEIIEEYYLTRHRKIAETAMEILSVRFGVKPNQIYYDLAQASREVKKGKGYLPGLGEWDRLPTYFFEKGDNRELGIRIAERLVELSPYDGYLLTQAARLLRKAERYEESRELLIKTVGEPRRHRSLYLEWGKVESRLERHGLSVWLIAIALSDDRIMTKLDFETAYKSLNALSSAFITLSDLHGDPIYKDACAAAATLGLEMPVSAETGKTRGVMRNNLSRSREPTRPEGFTPQSLLDVLEIGIITACQRTETANLPEWIKSAGDMSFTELLRLAETLRAKSQKDAHNFSPRGRL